MITRRLELPLETEWSCWVENDEGSALTRTVELAFLDTGEAGDEPMIQLMTRTGAGNIALADLEEACRVLRAEVVEWQTSRKKMATRN